MPDSFDWGLLEPLNDGSGAAHLTGDDAYLRAMLGTEAALISAWVDSGLAPDWAREAVPAVLSAPIDRAAIAAGNRAGGNPIIPLVTQLRSAAEAAHDGAAAWVHRGATSQDILDTAAITIALRSTEHIANRLSETASALAELTETHASTPISGRTLSQHAAPTTFGAITASWLDGVDAALETVESLTFPVQFGGSVGTGTAIAQLAGRADAPEQIRAHLAQELDLSDPGFAWHTERSAVAAIAAAVSLTIGTQGRIAADLVGFARTEVSEVTENAGAGAGTSSAMAHKHNPATAILIVAAAKRAPSLLATVHGALVSEDQRPAGAWHAEWQALRELLRIGIEVADASTRLISNLDVDRARMLDNLGLTGGAIVSEQVQSELTAALGVGAARRLVTDAAASAESDGTAFVDVVVRSAAAAGVPGVDATIQPSIAAAARVAEASLARHAARRSGGLQ